MEANDLKQMPVKDIRSEPITFQITVLKQIERINYLFPKTYEYLNQGTALALGGSIKTLNAMLKPFAAATYEEESKEKIQAVYYFEDLLKKEDKSYRRDYLEALFSWYELLLKQLTMIGVISKQKKRLVCMSKEDYIRLGNELFGEGKFKVEFFIEEEESEDISNTEEYFAESGVIGNVEKISDFGEHKP